MTYSKIISELRSDKKILITGHLNPDADCIGSMIALYNAFEGEKKNWQMVLQDSPPANLLFLPQSSLIRTPSEIGADFDSIFLVDCNEVSRVSDGWLALQGRELFIIDHHQTNMTVNDNIIIDSKAAAAGELVYKIIKAANIPMNYYTALCLYTAIASDTAFFRQAHTTSDTLLIGSELLAMGMDTEQIRIQLFENYSPENLLMIAEAIKSMERYEGGKVVFMSLSNHIINKYHATKDDFMGVVGFTLCMDGAQIGVLFEEKPDDRVRISFRCRKGYVVNTIAEALGGGGHLMAAGAVVNGSLDDVKQQALKLIQYKLKGMQSN